MSDLREKMSDILAEVRTTDHYDSCHAADRILALFELSAVERERQAFMEGWKYGALFDKSDYVTEASRRYPLPKEGA